MSGREHQRIPYAVQVQFRTASSFLVAYSVNLSRGGLFVETDQLLDTGTEVALQFAVPGTGPLITNGRVAWHREEKDPNGPRGIGIEFDDIGASVGPVIDRLVANFSGVNILLLAPDDHDRKTISRLIRSIISTAEVVSAADAEVAETMLDSEIDLVVIDLDERTDEGLATLVMARAQGIPTVALGSDAAARERARDAGADEVATNPPPSAEFQRILVGALGKPSTIRRT